MFDFDHWREWLKGETERLSAEGFAMEFLSNDEHLRGTCMQGKERGLISSFRNYETGHVDYEVMSEAEGKFLSNEAMIAVSDANFEVVFGKLRQALGLEP